MRAMLNDEAPAGMYYVPSPTLDVQSMSWFLP
jgi:hypothetical protein